MHGAAGENRTHDPVLTKDVRYHYATAAMVPFLVGDYGPRSSAQAAN